LKAGADVKLLDLSKDGFGFSCFLSLATPFPPSPSQSSLIPPRFAFSSFDRCFPVLVERQEEKAKSLSLNRAAHGKLEVHEVGAYKISVAPTLADLRRIDRDVFVIAPNIEQLMTAQYSAGYGF